MSRNVKSIYVQVMTKIVIFILQQSVTQTHFGSYFQKGKIFPFKKEHIFPFLKNHPLLEDTKFKLSLCLLVVFGALRNVSFSGKNYILKIFTGRF